VIGRHRTAAVPVRRSTSASVAESQRAAVELAEVSSRLQGLTAQFRV
jgi:methyl-accepting chemotaxis protein